MEACSIFRKLGHDVRYWSTKVEAWNNNTAFEIATSATVDFTLAIPDDNRAARMRKVRVASWMHEACFYLCSSLKHTSGTATVFLGDGDLSPSVPFPAVYTEIISSLQRGLQSLHVPVIRKVSGIKHLEDGVHWSTESGNAVYILITQAIGEARSCAEFVQTPELPYRCCRYDHQRYRDYPSCIYCGIIMKPKGYTSEKHQKLCSGVSANNDPSVDLWIPPVKYTINGNTRYGEFRSVANVKGDTQEKMPNCGLPRQGEIYLNLGKTNKIKFRYSLEHAGANRDFVIVANQCWGIKFELGHQKDHCRNEWLLYRTLPHLRKVTPQCFGFARFDYEGTQIHALLVERITSTVDKVVVSMRLSNHTFELEQLLVHLVVKTVTALAYLAREGLVRCRDWHTRKIAFSNVSTIVDWSDMRLLNWTNHHMEPCTPGRDRMAEAMRDLISNLPGQEINYANLQYWDTRMNHTITTLGTWWNSLADVPLSQQLEELKTLLLLADADEGIDTADASTKEPQHIGLDDKYMTLKTLAKVAQNHTDYVEANLEYRKGFHTDYSIPLEERRLYDVWYPFHGEPTEPGGTVEEGTAFRLICDLLLTVLKHGHFLKRIRPDKCTGLVPKAARDTTKFHRQYWKAFQTICGDPFTTKTPADQYIALRTFLWQKFSTDPKGKDMVPPEGGRAKHLSWDGF